MKIIKIATALLIASLILSCSNPNSDAKQAAEKYVTDYILPLLPDAQIKEFENRLGQSQTPVVFVKNEEQRVSFAADIATAIMEYTKKNDKYLNYRTEFIVRTLKNAGASALYNADVSKGVYVVTLKVQFDPGILRYEDFYVVLSKDMKVLNKPIDIENINLNSMPDNYIHEIVEF